MNSFNTNLEIELAKLVHVNRKLTTLLVGKTGNRLILKVEKAQKVENFMLCSSPKMAFLYEIAAERKKT